MSSTITREEFDTLKKEVDALKKSKMGKPVKKTRAPSEFNKFVGSEIKKIKTETPDIKHTEAFKTAVERWKSKK